MCRRKGVDLHAARDLEGRQGGKAYALLHEAMLRAAAGVTEKVAPMEKGPAQEAAGNVVDLTQLLRQSLSQRAPRVTARTKRAPAKKAKAVARKRA